ncbi:hypothetical protein J0S82_000085 [Galemys pyrenaicus]|uniref:Uncharacterized protein n=1 Tax=Galemys pyrenaicus TaxID=202257 RepID=A0A8J6AJK5_GALPY|nr:hypothetical protein J0S82_000085 [Galemys pyrenaicus]
MCVRSGVLTLRTPGGGGSGPVDPLSGSWMLMPFFFSPQLQCDFFKRTHYYRIMPKYHAVRIREEERYPPPGSTLPAKKHWVTSWQTRDRYY